MKEKLVEIPLFVNIFMFLIGTVLGINPNLVTVSAPGGYVFQLSYSALGFGLGALCIAMGLIGIRVLGSGLSDATVQIITRVVIYSILWLLFSTVTFAFLIQVPLFGIIIYSVFSILYAIGTTWTVADLGGGGVESSSKSQGTHGGEQ